MVREEGTLVDNVLLLITWKLIVAEHNAPVVCCVWNGFALRHDVIYKHVAAASVTRDDTRQLLGLGLAVSRVTSRHVDNRSRFCLVLTRRRRQQSAAVMELRVRRVALRGVAWGWKLGFALCSTRSVAAGAHTRGGNGSLLGGFIATVKKAVLSSWWKSISELRGRGCRVPYGITQPTVAVRASRFCLPERLLSAATTASSRPLLVDGCHQDDGPGVYHQSPGLM